MDTISEFDIIYIKALTEAVNHVVTYKKKLISIVLEEIPNEEKLEKIRIEILKYRASTCSSTNINCHNNNILDGISSVDKLKYIMEMLNGLLCALEPYHILYENISKIIKKENLDVQKKIEQISNLLL